MSEPTTAAWRSLAECGASVHDGPFPFGWVDAYLPDRALADLAAGFPSLLDDPAAQRMPRGKRRLVLTSADAGRDGLATAWTDAVTAVSAPDFLDQTLSFARTVRAQEHAEDVPPRVAQAHDRLRVEDLDVQVEAAEMADGAYLPPHTDAADKLVSCVLGLPTVEPWPSSWGGHTQILRAKAPRANWSNTLGDIDDFDVVAEVPVRTNRLFWFVKTAASWHAVVAATPPAPHARRSFNVSVVVSARGRARTGLDDALREVAADEAVER